MFLIFDTETTGLPKKWSAPLTDFDNWPRAIQVAWQVHDLSGKCISNHLLNRNRKYFRHGSTKYPLFLNIIAAITLMITQKHTIKKF